MLQQLILYYHCVYFFTGDVIAPVEAAIATFGLFIAFLLPLTFLLPLLCSKKRHTQQEQAADIPVQMTGGQNDEPDQEVHIGLDQEQQTHEIEDEVIPSDDNVYLIDRN